MIVSHKHRFIFLKSRKTGGTSLELALSAICGETDIITSLHERHEVERRAIGGLTPRNCDVALRRHRLQDWNLIRTGRGRRAFWEHVEAREAKAWLLGSVWREYYKFSIERNPWDRAISFYWWRSRAGETVSMLEFFRSVSQNRISNLGFYTIDDDVTVDHVIRYERLEEETAALTERFGLDSPIVLPRAKSGARKDRRSYREVLGSAEREVIARRCAKEIELFGYEF
jgi:hypothetical protein